MKIACIGNTEELVCENCGEDIEICTGELCLDKYCGYEWIHTKSKKHECELVNNG